MKSRSNSIRRFFASSIFMILFILFASLSNVQAVESPRPVEDNVLGRLRSLEHSAVGLARDVEPILKIYKSQITKALLETKAEVQKLKSKQNVRKNVRKCDAGVDRWRTCVAVWSEVRDLLSLAYAHQRVAEAERELYTRLSKISEELNRSAFAVIPEINSDRGIVPVLQGDVKDEREKIIKKLDEIRASLMRVVSDHSGAAARAASTALLPPMIMLAEWPASEKVDVIILFTNSIESAISELNGRK